MSSFGEKLKELRRKMGLSQDALGEKIGIHGRHVGKYEVGKALPNADTVIKIAKLFNVSIDYLLLDEESNPTPAMKISDKDLLENFAKISKFEEKEKDTVKSLLEAFIAKQQIKEIVGR